MERLDFFLNLSINSYGTFVWPCLLKEVLSVKLDRSDLDSDIDVFLHLAILIQRQLELILMFVHKN